MAGAPHTDREDGQMPNTVVAMEVGVEARAQNYDGYEDVKTTGSGKAYISKTAQSPPPLGQKRT